MNDEYSSNEEEAKITFRNIPAEDHKSFMTNRIWGGLQAGGLFELNFLLEHKPIPKEVTEKVKEKRLEEVSREESAEIIRENQATVYMSLETLLSLYEWLERKIKELGGLGIISEERLRELEIIPEKEEG